MISNSKLQTIRVVPKQVRLYSNFEQKVIEETNITKNGKITIFEALTDEFTKIKAHLMAKQLLLIRRPFSFNLPNFKQF